MIVRAPALRTVFRSRGRVFPAYVALLPFETVRGIFDAPFDTETSRPTIFDSLPSVSVAGKHPIWRSACDEARYARYGPGAVLTGGEPLLVGTKAFAGCCSRSVDGSSIDRALDSAGVLLFDGRERLRPIAGSFSAFQRAEVAVVLVGAGSLARSRLA